MPDDNRISTDELLALLFKERDLEHFLQRNESAYLTASFSEYLIAWCRQHLDVPEQVIRRANLEKSASPPIKPLLSFEAPPEYSFSISDKYGAEWYSQSVAAFTSIIRMFAGTGLPLTRKADRYLMH